MIIKCQKYCLAILGIKELYNNKANPPNRKHQKCYNAGYLYHFTLKTKQI